MTRTDRQTHLVTPWAPVGAKNSTRCPKNYILHDSVLQISSHFGYYEAGQSNKIERLEATAIFKEDWISLQNLYNSSRLHFLTMPGDHMDFDAEWFRENIVDRFLI